jgi:hypothetical protein
MSFFSISCGTPLHDREDVASNGFSRFNSTRATYRMMVAAAKLMPAYYI